MLNLVKACAPWLSWKTAAVAGLVAVGLALCLGMPGLGLLAGAAPVLLILACLIPCLIPPALLRRGSRNKPAATQATIPLSEQGAATCGCGKESCGIGDGPAACRSEAAAR